MTHQVSMVTHQTPVIIIPSSSQKSTNNADTIPSNVRILVTIQSKLTTMIFPNNAPTSRIFLVKALVSTPYIPGTFFSFNHLAKLLCAAQWLCSHEYELTTNPAM